jgi:hypothetical protein
LILGALAKLRKATISVMFCQPVRMEQHGVHFMKYDNGVFIWGAGIHRENASFIEI